jgi:ketosteroid isomerase-like protein
MPPVAAQLDTDVRRSPLGRMRAIIFTVALLAACSSARLEPSAAPATAAPVIAAERAFAARAGEIGWIPAFREYTAPDGQTLGAGGYENAPQSLAETPDDGNRNLFWWPAFAGVSRSGDIGFTTGPASFDAARTPRIYYFTIWRRQPNGTWRWIYDGGPGPVVDPASVEPGAEPAELPIATRGVGAAASAQVNALEASATNAGELARYIAEDAYVHRTRLPRVSGLDAAAAMVTPSADVAYTRLRTEASAAGDLVFTLGTAQWTQDGATRNGYYARVWQYRTQGWVIVYDHLIIPRAPAPPQ